MFETLQTWLQFALVSAVIVVAGYHLSRYGDVIAEKTGLSGSWVGLALLATVTSLPELATGISSVVAAHETDIAVGNVLGAFMAVLIAIEIYHNIILYAEDHRDHRLAVEIVLGTALMAISRKVIVFDFKETTPEHIYGSAAVILALVIGYYLITVRGAPAAHDSRTTRDIDGKP
jgi:Ca2+/Na+ antiporter